MPYKKITGDEPYFEDIKGFKRHGVFVPVIPHLVEALTYRHPDHIQQFEEDTKALLSELHKNPTAEKAMLTMLDRLRAKGLVVMIKRKTDILQYHIAEHSAEASYDTGRVLEVEFSEHFPSANDVAPNAFFLELAKAAVAWHDVIQSEAPPINEEKSAAEFVQQSEFELTQFANDYPALKQVIDAFKKHLVFIGKELIVYDTWLVFGNEKDNGLIAKPFRFHIDHVMQDLEIDQSHLGPMTQRLLMASKTISVSDVSRYALKHVLDDKTVLNAFQSLPKELRDPVNDFLSAACIHSAEEKEVFLGLFGTNIRMFTELNHPCEHHQQASPPMNATNISKKDHDDFIRCMMCLRESDNPLTVQLELDYIKLFRLLMDTYCYNSDNSALAREQVFARAQQYRIWQKYADDLDKFKEYSDKLEDEPLARLSQCLFILSTHFQPGLIYLNNDKTFQDVIENASTQKFFAIKIP